MCRLFGLRADHRISATFWLLQAPDSLSQQSRREPDGTGIAIFDEARVPVVDKQPIAAFQDEAFATEARELHSETFVAHVRFASTGAHTVANTHPFQQDGRVFAHNGAIGGLAELDRELDKLGVTDLVRGQTDSERVFVLITAFARANGGDVTAAITEAVGWIAQRLPVLALNFIVATADELWALRYPDTHELWVLDRPTGEALHATSARINAHSANLSDVASVVVATERMDDDPHWRLLGRGELLHIDAGLNLASTRVTAPLRHRLSLADLGPAVAASQR
jgi:predicted glutamine amidotransferase